MMPSDFYEPRKVLVAVDPGLRGSGLAVFRGGLLRFATYVQNPAPEGRGPTAHLMMAEAIAEAAQDAISTVDSHNINVCVEFPQVYPGPQKIDVNDLLDIAGVSSACMLAVASWYGIHEANCRWTLPRAWKGNIKKEIMTARIGASLTPAERVLIVSAGAKDHNTLDAIGIGLWQLGRLNQRKIFS